MVIGGGRDYYSLQSWGTNPNGIVLNNLLR
jgi:hypothetical protein